MRQLGLFVLMAGSLLSTLGCGGGGERGMNKDYDRPRPVAADTRR